MSELFMGNQGALAVLLWLNSQITTKPIMQYKHWMVIKCMIEKFASIAQLEIIYMIMKMANFLLHRVKLNLSMNMKSPDLTDHSIDDLRREMNEGFTRLDEGITRINNNLTALADVFNRNFRQ